MPFTLLHLDGSKITMMRIAKGYSKYNICTADNVIYA